jgi:hypothetical protein
MATEFCLRKISIHARKVLLHAVNLRHGTDGFTSPLKEVVLRILITLKNPSTSVGIEPANLGSTEDDLFRGVRYKTISFYDIFKMLYFMFIAFYLQSYVRSGSQITYYVK